MGQLHAIHFIGVKMQLVLTVKLLGLHFEWKLTWKHHIKKQYKQYQNPAACSGAFGTTYNRNGFGLSSQRVHWM